MTEKKASSGSQIRLVVVIVIGIAAIIFAFQNRDPVPTKFLWLEPSLPRVVLILITAAVGFVAGYVARGFRKK